MGTVREYSCPCGGAGYAKGLCKPCYDRKQWAENKGDIRLRSLRFHLKKAYGLSLEDFETLLKKSKGLCTICKRVLVRYGPEKNSRPCVDHNHKTGKVRGVICYSCNVGLGHFLDSPEVLNRAARYLRARE